MPRIRRHVTNRETVSRIGTAVEVLDEELRAAVQILAHVGEKTLIILVGDRLVHLPPVHVVFGRRFSYDELVVRRASRVRSRARHERARCGEFAFVTARRGLHELGRDEIPVDPARRGKTLLRQTN